MKIDHKKLLAFVDAVAALAPECRVWLKEGGLETRAVDTANVAMVSAKLPKESFTEYKAAGEGLKVMGLDLIKTKTALNILDKAGQVTLIESGNRLQMSDGKYNYGNALLDVNTIRKDPNPPNIALPAVLEVPAGELHEVIRAMSLINDKVTISAKGGTLKFETEGDTDHLKKEIEGRAVKDTSEWFTSLFSLDYLKDLAKVLKSASGDITVSVGTDHPIRFACTVEGIAVEYLLAPRIDAKEG
ncbi:MAG TPA: DNA polymerase sliding clamp [Methanoregulaceae archaeon]|nr:DNA polymerase sliding clamp [Methanoregulaceae archaeon]